MRIKPECLKEIIRMSRFYRWQAFPGKAFLLLKAALAQKAIAKTPAPRRRAQREQGVVDWADTELTAKTLASSGRAQLTVRDIQALVKTRTGLPSFLLFREEPVERQALVEKLRAQLFEQEQAIEAVVDAILTFKAEINDPERPLANFLFTGPTGVGKTELVKLVADLLFGSRSRVIRYDMGEYTDPESVSRLAGEGRQDGPRRGLVEEVLAEPFSVILLDEVEKAHPSLFSLLLPVLGEGQLTDVSGRTASFANTIIIMTSNLGADLYGRRPIGLSPSQAEGGGFEIERAILQKIRAFFAPEFLNRLTKILHFRPLSREAVARVAEKTIHEALARPGLRDLNLQVSVDASLFEELLKRGYHPEYGARPMQRAVEELVVYPLARVLASGRVASSQPVHLTWINGQTNLSYVEAVRNGKRPRARSRRAGVRSVPVNGCGDDRTQIGDSDKIAIGDRTAGGR
jgi:ATP-dependent Clp protease ATP-binding subunit ClpA